jgi:ORF6N domain
MARSLRRPSKTDGTAPTAVSALIPIERIERSILLIRNEKVMLDADLAELYGVTTRRLKEQVRRNRDRFPPDFLIELSAEEKAEVVANCDHLGRLKYSPSLPLAFTEHGAIMAANVLSSQRAVAASVMVVRAFVRLRQMLASHVDLARKLAELETRYDGQFRQVFTAIRALMATPEGSGRTRIGF